MVLSPAEIPLGEKLSIKVFELPDFDSQKDTSEMVDMTAFLKKDAELDSIGKAQEAKLDAIEDSLSKINADRLANATANKEMQAQKERQEKIGEIKQAIEYPDSVNYVLDSFFESLQNLSKNPSLMRIVHYGDSQVEGDRITDYLRNRLQNRFGGCGVGIVPMLEKQAFRNTLASDESDSWNKFAVYGTNTGKANRPYGLLASYYRFASPIEKDSLSRNRYRAWVRFKQTNNNGKTDKSTQIENFKILYNSPKSELSANIKIEKNGKEKLDTTFRYKLEKQDAKGELAVFEQVIDTKFDKMHVAFESEAGSELYGMALDCNTGIAVDNVALRGSSGIEFTKMNKDFLRQHFKKLNIKLLILQFGVNVVPSEASSYDFYERLMVKQLRFLKSLSPDLCILVVGVSDMAHKQGTSYVSYRNIPKIREAQRNAAFKTGCAFWDLYEGMGGAGAMRSWVSSKPSLAGKDYTHFNARGAKVVGEMLYEALMKSYEEYKIREGGVFP
jgi:lysophospholipase L1-like esterase